MSFNEWKESKISDLIEIIGGGTPKTSIPEYWSGSIPWLSVKDFNTGYRYVYETEKTITEIGLNNSSTKLLKKDDLIISARGTVGALAQLGRPMAFNQSCYGLRAKEMTTNNFVYYLLKNMIGNIQQNTHGSVFNTITRDTFGILEANLPPLEEQKAIAHILSTLDDKIEVNNQINKTLENMAQAIFKQWFVDFEFPNEDGEPYKSSGGEMVESELGMIPKGWEVVHLKDKLNFERGIEPGSKNYSKTYFERSIPFYRVGDMLGIAQNYVDKNLINDKTLERRDVAVSFDGTVGRVVTGLRGSYSTGIRKIYAKKGEYFPNCFIYFLFKTEFIQSTIMQYASGTTILHASESIEYLAIPYHEEIIKKFVLIIEAIFNTIVNKKKENESLSNTRDILLPKLMSGEIRVPMDEEGDAS